MVEGAAMSCLWTPPAPWEGADEGEANQFLTRVSTSRIAMERRMRKEDEKDITCAQLQAESSEREARRLEGGQAATLRSR